MSVPKSVVKVNKNGVTYTSSVDACQYYLFELNRAALRDVAKFVKKRFREEYYRKFRRHRGAAGRAVSYRVISGKNTKFPRVQIGLRNGKIDGFYGFFQEFGSKTTPRYGILSDTVESNIATIVEIESKYLSGLNDEAQALALIDSEDDYESDNED